MKNSVDYNRPTLSENNVLNARVESFTARYCMKQFLTLLLVKGRFPKDIMNALYHCI